MKLPSSSEISRDQSCTFAGVEVSKPGRVADVDRAVVAEPNRRLEPVAPVGVDRQRRTLVAGHADTCANRAAVSHRSKYASSKRMAGRGKPQQKIVVACARELAGFVWAIATEQPLRNT